jgi:ATP-dependent RNA helicase RhlE
MEFKDLNLIDPLQKAVSKQGYTSPTPIQEKSIPDLLEGRDLIGIAQTGTGKTAAFVLPILQRMTKKNSRALRTLVLAPTRELAAQIGESFSAYGEYLNFKHTVIFGGVGQFPQIKALQHGVDIVVATPGRLLDLMNQGRVNLRDIEFFVLDEADRMLDMGFIHDIKKIIQKLPEKRQSLFFSATMSSEVKELANRLLTNPVHVEVTPQATTVESIDQKVFFVDHSSKERLLLEFLKEQHLSRVLIFTRTKHRANKLAIFLNKNQVYADAIHGNKSQNARIQALADFKSGRIKVLVATDIAARGIDIEDISHVINFELPNEPESYVHRIGRTARAGAEGTAYSLCSSEERDYLRDIERLIKKEIPVATHNYHSDTAQNAVGAAAKPAGRGRGGRRFGGGQRHFRRDSGRSERRDSHHHRSRDSRDRPSRDSGTKARNRARNPNFRRRF